MDTEPSGRQPRPEEPAEGARSADPSREQGGQAASPEPPDDSGEDDESDDDGPDG